MKLNEFKCPLCKNNDFLYYRMPEFEDTEIDGKFIKYIDFENPGVVCFKCTTFFQICFNCSDPIPEKYEMEKTNNMGPINVKFCTFLGFCGTYDSLFPFDGSGGTIKKVLRFNKDPGRDMDHILFDLSFWYDNYAKSNTYDELVVDYDGSKYIVKIDKIEEIQDDLLPPIACYVGDLNKKYCTKNGNLEYLELNLEFPNKEHYIYLNNFDGGFPVYFKCDQCKVVQELTDH